MRRIGALLPRFTRLLAALLVVALALPIAAPTLAATGADYVISGGWFFTETGGGNGNGFAVRDAGTDAVVAHRLGQSDPVLLTGR
jgi:hypothetical protein